MDNMGTLFNNIYFPMNPDDDIYVLHYFIHSDKTHIEYALLSLVFCFSTLTTIFVLSFCCNDRTDKIKYTFCKDNSTNTDIDTVTDTNAKKNRKIDKENNNINFC